MVHAMTIRDATPHECRTLSPLSELPAIVVEDDGEIVAYSFFEYKPRFIVHNTYAPGNEALAMIAQRLRKLARDWGHDELYYSVEPSNTDMLRLVKKGRAQIDRVWVRMQVTK